MEEADDRGGPGILTDCLAGLADTTIWADRGPIDQNPSKIEPQHKEDAALCFGFKAATSTRGLILPGVYCVPADFDT